MNIGSMHIGCGLNEEGDKAILALERGDDVRCGIALSYECYPAFGSGGYGDAGRVLFGWKTVLTKMSDELVFHHPALHHHLYTHGVVEVG